MRLPPPLRKGDRIAVVAPASPSPRSRLLSGLAWLRGRYDLVYSPEIFDRTGFLAGSDATRGRDFTRALAREGVRAIFAARGGWGALRIASRIPWDALVDAGIWLAGFSDVTTLHLELARRGLASIHSPNVTGLGVMDATARSRREVIRALEDSDRPWGWGGLSALRPGRGEGPLFGGNLTLVFAQAAAGRLRVPDGAVVCLEDVTERPYRLDRALTALREGGHFDRASAVVFGDFTSCDPGPDGITIDEVLASFAQGVGIPVLGAAPFGHGTVNDAFVLGRRVIVDAARGTIVAA